MASALTSNASPATETSVAQSSAVPVERPAQLAVRARHAALYAVRSLAESWRAFRAARRGDGLALAAALMRMRAKHFLWKVSPRWIFQREQLFGWTLNCFDYYEMITTFEIIFLAREYRFSPRDARPRIIDCGSNIGLSLLFFKREYPESVILAFEPDPQTFSLLRKNVEQNGLPGIELHNLALGGSPGSRVLFCDSERPGSTAMTLVPGCGLGLRKTVQCALLSEFIREDVDLLKLDIEGAELEVIADLVSTGKIRHVQQMAIEYHPVLFPDYDGYSWLRETLVSNGFECQLRSGALLPFGSPAPPPVTLFACRPAPTVNSQPAP